VLSELDFTADHRIISLIAAFSCERLAPLLKPAHQIVRAVPMPFAAQRRGPLALYPDPDWAADLLRPLGELIAAPSEATFNRFCAITATMSSYYLWLGGLTDWLAAGGIAPDLAARYVTSQIHALSLVPAELSEQVDFDRLAERFATKGGLNEQVAAGLSAVGMFDALRLQLDRVLLRIEGAQ
jgi:pyrroline-5-carboxylate reductase